MSTTIKVTQEDINSGSKSSSFGCPVANAINRVLKSPFRASVCKEDVLISNSIYGEFLFPKEVTKRIWEFDKRGTMEPFEFELLLPQDVLA